MIQTPTIGQKVNAWNVIRGGFDYDATVISEPYDEQRFALTIPVVDIRTIEGNARTVDLKGLEVVG